MQLNVVFRHKGEVAEFVIEDIKGEWQIKKLYDLAIKLYRDIKKKEAMKKVLKGWVNDIDIVKQAEDILKKGGKDGNK